ncbi:MAG: hypothetical protein LBR26_10085 [Prevotella sp.]|nr:hypothetical protein [Prevotella sp.]
MYCPVDNDARILVFSTPKFAKMVSRKYSRTGSSHVQRDLKENHGRSISWTYIRNISRAVRDLALSRRQWEYAAPVEAPDVSTTGISLDSTCMKTAGVRQWLAVSVFMMQRVNAFIRLVPLNLPNMGKKRLPIVYRGKHVL